MSITFVNLIFEPDIKTIDDENDVLWSAQLNVNKNYKSIISTIILDNISHSNRRLLSDWIRLLNENDFMYSVISKSKYCHEYKILDVEKDLKFLLFACDVNAANYNLEIDFDDILPILSILDLNKNGSLHPLILKNKIKNAEFILSVNEDLNENKSEVILKYLKKLEKLIDHCINYECDVKFYITKN